MEALVSLFITLPIILLNFVGGIVAGVWLIIVGKWALVIGAFFSTLVSTWILGLLLLPSLLFAAPLMWAAERKKYFFVFIFGAFASLWTYTLMLFYGVGSFIFVFNNYESGSIFPYLLLAYSVSTGPWTYMAAQESKSGESRGSDIGSFGMCLAAISMIGAVLYFGSPTRTILVVACAIPLVLTWLYQAVLVVQTMRSKTEII